MIDYLKLIKEIFLIVLRLLLFPFALLYDVVTRLRNHLFNIQYRRSFEFDRTVISVGNLTIGGAGKTPMIEYLTRLLKEKYKLAILSRGYGRKTKGFHIADLGDSAATIGDEPFQYFRKFTGEITVAVGEDRALAIPEIILAKPDIEVILLDDAYQHRTVKPKLNILLTEYSKPFFKDHILPMGNLRESRQCARRADAIVVTKCPFDISKSEKEKFKTSVKKYNSNKPVFFSFIQYGIPQPINAIRWSEPEQIILVSGIANTEAFESYARSKFKIVNHFNFPDHHTYREEEIAKINQLCLSFKPKTCVITTEKDMVKILPFKNSLLQVAWFYIPIEVNILEDGGDFDELILAAIKS